MLGVACAKNMRRLLQKVQCSPYKALSWQGASALGLVPELDLVIYNSLFILLVACGYTWCSNS